MLKPTLSAAVTVAGLFVASPSSAQTPNPHALNWVPVIAEVDVLAAAPQQVAFVSKVSGCRFFGKSAFDSVTRAWVVAIDTERCGNEIRQISAQILPAVIGRTIPEGAPLLHAGDGAFMERKW